MPWSAVASVVIVFIGAVAVPALIERHRRTFASREGLDDMQARMDRGFQRMHLRIDEARDQIQGAVSLMATIEDRVGDTERRQDRLEERHQHQWHAVTKDVSNTVMALKDVTKELREVSEMQRILFDRMERDR